jgi:septum formation protein
MHVERSGAPQLVAVASPASVAKASAALAATRKAGFRRSRIAGELITGLVAWYGALVALDPPRLVLGSASPRRREILERLGLAHVVIAPAADETVLAGEAVAPYLQRVVLLKLEAVRRAPAIGEGRHTILVADTSVVLGDEILGKPRDAEECRTMIARLSGVTHEVHTRFALGDLAGVFHEETVVSRVTFRALDRDELDAYPATG